MIFFRQFQHLLPRARAWRITVDKYLRRFFLGLTGIGADIKEFIDLIYLDLFAQTTRRLDDYEDQLNLPDTGLTEQQRRDRLDSALKSLGGQDPRYIQDTLQASGFDVYIHEWWWPGVPSLIVLSGAGSPVVDGSYDVITEQSNGFYTYSQTGLDKPFIIYDESDASWTINSVFLGIPTIEYISYSITGKYPPKTGWTPVVGVAPPPVLDYEDPFTVRPPLDYLRRNAKAIILYGAGDPELQAGEALALAGEGVTLAGYALVNKIYQTRPDLFSLAGEPLMQAGETSAVAGNFNEYGDDFKDYIIPDDPDRWPYFLYIGGEVFGDLATIDGKRRNEFETLCLKICPAQQWLGMLVNYS